MSKTITIRKSGEDERWLREECKRTKLSEGKIVKNLLEKARRAKAPKKHPFAQFAGILKLSRDASMKEGFRK